MKKLTYFLLILFLGVATIVKAQYRDAEAFEAKGNVKMIIKEVQMPTKTVRFTYSFSSDGALTSTDQGDIVSLERDNQGRLSKYVYNRDGSYNQYEYDAQGRVSRKNTDNGYSAYEYDSNGLIVKNTEKYLYSLSWIDYQYLDFDDHGNWTKRIVNNQGSKKVETREIYYWPDTATQSTGEGSTSHPRELIVLDDVVVSGNTTRYIDEKYRDFLEYVLHGQQNDYKIIMGQTRLSPMSKLSDVIYSDLRGNENAVNQLKIGSDEREISFNSSISSNDDILSYINYAPEAIPDTWKTRYGIDKNIYNDPIRRQKLANLGFKFLSESPQTRFQYGIESYYVGSNIYDQMINLEMMLDGDKLLFISIALNADKNGHLPQLRETSDPHEGSATVAETSTTTTSSQGGFLNAFDKLAKTTAQQEALKRQIRERSLQRQAAANATTSTNTTTETTTKTSSNQTTVSTNVASASDQLTALSMVNHPFGVLDSHVTAQTAVQQLLQKGWLAELLDRTRIVLNTQRKYNLTYDNRIPECTARFADTEDGQLLSYDYTFSFSSGKDVPDTYPTAALRLRAIRFAHMLASELQLQGINLEEVSNAGPATELLLRYAGADRTIQISVESRMDAYTVTLSISDL